MNEEKKVRRLSPQKIAGFRRTIYRHYRQNARDFAWRRTTNPYRILVSEFMLQQTQTERVALKYQQFLQRFPDFKTLAASSLRDVLEVWQGLGYNRRAKMLGETARIVVNEYGGKLPRDVDDLRRLPGIGPATAAAIAAFGFSQPAVLLETNIRRVFIHFFFPTQQAVKDAQIIPLVQATLDRVDPRHWYYALMDYGVMLKKNGKNANHQSAHYQKQPPFEGSNRQVRGAVLKTLLVKPKITKPALARELGLDAGGLDGALAQLIGERLVKKTGKWLILAED
jgi:A/G-specific adenine glycosylase